MFTLTFVKKATERAVKTAAQAVLTVWVVGDQIANALQFDWALGAGVAAGGAIVSILTSIVSEPFGEPGTPSLVDGPSTTTPIPSILTALVSEPADGTSTNEGSLT